MNDKLNKMVQLAKELRLGESFTFKGMTAEVLAFSDEHVFVTIPEIAVSPEEFEGAVGAKRVEDKAKEELKRQIWQLEREIDRLLHDPQYREYRMDQAYRERRYRERRYDDMRVALAYGAVSIQNIGIEDYSAFTERPSEPAKPIWIDPLWGKEPSAGQKKSKKK